MESHAPSASSASTAPPPMPGRHVGPVRRLAWVAVSGVGTLLWLQYPSDLSFLGNLLLGLSPALLFPTGSHRQSVSPRAAVASVLAVLLIVLAPIVAYFFFGWSLPQHPHAILGIKIAWVLVWLTVAAIQLRHVFASRRASSTAKRHAAAKPSSQPPHAAA